MSEGDKIWQAYKKSVAPVKRTQPQIRRLKTAVDKKAARQAAETVPAPQLNVTAKSLSVAVTLERRREKALRQGGVGIDAKLDLHGLTQAPAFAALADFIARHVKAGSRCLLIVTGKGGPNKSGVLRASLKDWLARLPEASRILTIRAAAARHGGDGAFYVILRKFI